MLDTANQIAGSQIAYSHRLRTITAPGGKAVRLSRGEMLIFHAIARAHPEATALPSMPRNVRHVLVHRLRAKLRLLGCGVLHVENEGYLLRLAQN
ncbi:hypothetical protein [Hyphomicrobium sp. DY-1]|uniref:hypothetical protein n=1 Tax=Hyphomicrobium sp. DY-1 TaxID=3075650 RepID=UPI0039C0E32F